MNDTHTVGSEENQFTAFGNRLKTAREALGLASKEAAMQLRLSEKMIDMIEAGTYPSNFPITFIRGYIRSYGKLLQVPEYEINKGLEPIKTKVANNPLPVPKKNEEPITINNYFMQLITFLIAVTLIGLVSVWWYTHYTNSSTTKFTITPILENHSSNTKIQPATPITDHPPIIKIQTSSSPINTVNQPNQIRSLTPIITTPSVTSSVAHSSNTIESTINHYPLRQSDFENNIARPSAKINSPHLSRLGLQQSVQFFWHGILFLIIGLISLKWFEHKIISNDERLEQKQTIAHSIKTTRILTYITIGFIIIFCPFLWNSMNKTIAAAQIKNQIHVVVIPENKSIPPINPLIASHKISEQSRRDHLSSFTPVATYPKKLKAKHHHVTTDDEDDINDNDSGYSGSDDGDEFY